MTVRQGLIYALSCGLVALGIASSANAQAGSLTLNLASQNNSGITGTATMMEMGGGRTRVDIRVTGAGAGPEPAHIHEGSCTQLNPTPQFSLTNVTNGSSTTEIMTTVASLTGSPHAVHLHKSPDELTVYVACADIRQPGTLPRSGDAETWPGLAMAAAGVILAGAGLLLRRRSA